VHNEPSRRERNKERTRTAIERAALELFETQGFDQTTAEQIADRADVSLRTFFRYFPTKEQVVFAHWAEPITTLSDLIAAQPPELNAFDAARRAYATFAGAHPYVPDGDHRRMVSIFMGSPNLRGRSGRALRAWEAGVSSGLERREGACDTVDPELVGAVLGAALKWATRRCRRDPSLDLHEQVLSALDQIDLREPAAAAPAPDGRARRSSGGVRAGAGRR